jgi:small GTP-binding protein
MPEPKANFKFIVIGSSGVGKTAILKRLVDDVFTGESQSTIGVEFMATSIDVDGDLIKLQIWDTAGQERFRSIAKAYFRSAIGVILVFDLTDRKSFEELNQWLSDVHALCDPNAVMTLVGNKSDLSDGRTITATEAESFAQLHQLAYLETSAMAGHNVQEAFQRTAATVYRKTLANKDLKSVDNGAKLEGGGGGGGCC